MIERKVYQGNVFAAPFCLLTLLIILMSMVNGCGWLAGAPRQDPMAKDLVEHLERKNQDVRQLKGFLRIRLHSPQGVISGRAALAAIFPDRVRVEWLTFLGQPLMKFAADGQTITVDLHGEDRYHRIEQTPTALSKLIHIPMGVDELLRILKGNPPLPKYAAAQISGADTQGSRIALISRWHLLTAELKTTADGTIQEMTAFRNDGTILFQVHWKGWRQQQGYTFPGDIEIVSGTGEKVSLLIDRIYPGAPVPPELFRLEAVPSH